LEKWFNISHSKLCKLYKQDHLLEQIVIRYFLCSTPFRNPKRVGCGCTTSTIWTRW